MMALYIWKPELRNKLSSISIHVDLSEKKLTGRSYEHLAPKQA